MSKIFKNMVPYWKAVFVILALLLIQAMCDLALPSYTSDIIDVGIQKSGVEHVVPQAVTAEEFETAQLMMTEDEGPPLAESLRKGRRGLQADGERAKTLG